MPKTYDPSQLATSAIYRVRRMIGDVPPVMMLDDDEIAYELVMRGGDAAWADAVIPCLDVMIARSSSQVNMSAGAVREDAGARAAGLRRLRAELVSDGYTDPRAGTDEESSLQFLGLPAASDTCEYGRRNL